MSEAGNRPSDDPCPGCGARGRHTCKAWPYPDPVAPEAKGSKARASFFGVRDPFPKSKSVKTLGARRAKPRVRYE